MLPLPAEVPQDERYPPPAELAELRTQLRALQTVAYIPEHNPNPVLCFTPQGELLFANHAARQLRHGLEPTELAHLHQQLLAVSQLVLPPSVPLGIACGERHFTLTTVQDAPPDRNLILYLTETTARVTAERQLAEQQAFMEQILATVPSLIYVRDAQGRLVFQNQAMQELRSLAAGLDHDPETDAITSDPTEHVRYDQVNTQVLATGQQLAREDSLTLPTGEVRWYQTVKRLLLRPDGTRQVLGVSTDITTQKLTRQALSEREKLYHDLMTHSQALICTHSPEGHLLTTNPAIARLLGVPLAALPGRQLQELGLPRYQPEITAYLGQLTATGRQRGIATVMDGTGQLRHLLFDSHLVREEGQVPYAISYGQDVTERLQAEHQLRQAKRAAEAAVLARESFLANISHELRTPLNGVLSMAKQLAKTTLDGQQQEFVQTIRHSGQHLLHVINDVLDMAKITSGKLAIEVRAFNLCESVSEALRPLAVQAVEKGLDFASTALRTTCAHCWVLGDSHRINQIIINLVANAIKFTEPGGRVVVVGEQLAATDAQLTVRFSVEDTGVGIEADKQEMIFEGFTQAHADTARRFGGTGLGLSISRALVTQLGGELTVHSTPGVGSTFAFTLTLPKAPNSALPAPDAYDTGALRGRRLLVVEDNEVNRTVARLLLESWGAHVDEAEDGLLGVARVQHELPYDLVLMDIQLPGLNGLDATQAIRALPDPARANSRIVALTANAFQGDCAHYLAAGMSACLTKPLEEEKVYHTLVSLLPPPLPYDLTRLRTLARGREEFVQKIIRSFLQNMPGSLAQLKAAAAAGHWAEAARIVHHVKPSLESLGVPAVAPLVAQLESAAPDDYAQLLLAALELTTKVQNALEALPQEIEGQ